MARFKLMSFLLVTATLMFVVSAEAQLGWLGNLLETVTGVVANTVSSLVKVVNNLLFDSRKILVIMKEGTGPIITAAANSSAAIWTEAERVQNIQNIVDALKQHTQESQGPLIQLLTTAGIQFKSHWITNTLEVLDCPLELIERVLALLSVKEVIYDIIISLDPPEPAIDSPSNTAAAGWGVNKIKAANVWATGNTGQGIVVGSIDTGVRGTHETLVNNWIGPYGWYDPVQKTATPFDTNGHGTHTLATIVGGKGVGVAPSAKWMACKACGSTCTLSLLNICAQYMLCPTDTNGNNCNPAKAPHIVSNSWGSGQGLTYFQPMIDAWHAARIIPVFSAGNSGAKGCSSVVSPGDSARVFSIGGSDTSDALGAFSSIGPAVNGLVKPDFVAPGVSIRSAWKGNNADYLSLSGTSMAAPHFAGTVALVLSARPGLCYDALKEVLMSSTDTVLPRAALVCGAIPDTVFPNNEYGYGRINALNVVNAALAF
ncbi:Subtilase family [Phytophthora infestans]|uniref:subtilisin n=1 Tax=Phytophthora infestans TaxID=4787 RepID=A0A8S9USE5_PHYIN|nr:Subtilase family [Phytophthora infestans]KAI9990682.1 hypothetical protein PInf_018239 [Phytophthora infestans]